MVVFFLLLETADVRGRGNVVRGLLYRQLRQFLNSLCRRHRRLDRLLRSTVSDLS